MPLEVRCPNSQCGKTQVVQDDQAGQTVPCLACAGPVTIPELPLFTRLIRNPLFWAWWAGVILIAALSGTVYGLYLSQLRPRDVPVGYMGLSSATGPEGRDFSTASTTRGTAFDSATLISLAPDGSATQFGRIDRTGKEDVYRFVAPLTSRLTVRQEAGKEGRLDSHLSIYDDSRRELANNDDEPTRGPHSRVDIEVVQGRTYYVKAAAYRNAAQRGGDTGDYVLRFSAGPGMASVSKPEPPKPEPPKAEPPKAEPPKAEPPKPEPSKPVAADDFGNAFEQAHPVTLPASGTASQAGRIETPGDVDMFRVVAPATGRLTVRQEAAPGSPLDSYLRAFDEMRRELASNDDEPNRAPHSRIEFDVVQGRTYYVKAAAFAFVGPSPKSLGEYRLLFSLASPLDKDDFGNTPETAHVFPLSPQGAGSQAGKIDMPGDEDVFRFVAPVTGRMTVRQEATLGSKLDSHLYVLDDAKKPLANNDDADPKTRNSRVEFDVVQGRTYYLKATAYRSTTPDKADTRTGAYTLTVQTVAKPGG